MIFVFLCLTSLSMIMSRSIHLQWSQVERLISERLRYVFVSCPETSLK